MSEQLPITNNQLPIKKRYDLFYWLKDSCKEPYGKYSAKRIIAYMLALIACFEAVYILHLVYNMVFENVDITSDSIQAVTILVDVFKYTCVMILILLGLISAQQIGQQGILGGVGAKLNNILSSNPSNTGTPQSPANSQIPKSPNSQITP